ncbi:hypothetical protein HOY82DRAFT_611047 [Tuber indicum]|nr:hypothetical protein HOY82DRAFT_611047 [Tuber indicum]
MSFNSHGGTSGRHVVTATTPSSFSPFPSSSNENTIPQNQTSSFSLSEDLPNSTPTDGTLSVVTCPVPSCPLAFKGEMSHGYLWRHLGNPATHGRTGGEKGTWLQLHRTERDQLVAAGITPEHRRREAKRTRARKVRFKSRAKNMGITEEGLVARKIEIWEGMYTAKESGDSMAVSVLYSLTGD